MPGVHVHGIPSREGRTPTVAFTVDGTPPDAVAAALTDDVQRLLAAVARLT